MSDKPRRPNPGQNRPNIKRPVKRADAPKATPVEKATPASAGDASATNAPQKEIPKKEIPKKEKVERAPKPTKPEKEKKKSNVFLIILVLLLLIGIGVLSFFFYDTDKKAKTDIEKLTKERTELEKAKSVQTNTLDSLSNVMDKQLELIGLLKGDTTALAEKLRDIKRKYRIALNSNVPLRQKNAALAKVKEQYERLLQEQDTELLRLRALTGEQQIFITELKDTISGKNLKISNNLKTISEQSDVIDEGQILRVESAQVYVLGKNPAKPIIDKKSKGFVSKVIKSLVIKLNIAPNRIAEETKKTFYAVLKEPSGIGLTGSLAGGTFDDAQGKTLYWTMKSEKTYSKSGIEVQLSWFKDPSYAFKKGTNSIDIYCEGHKIGTQEFIIKK